LAKEVINRIVVFAPNKPFFGANILQLPFFQHLRHNFTNAEIIIWSPVKASSMMLNNGLADKLYIYKNWKDYFKITVFLWRYKPDIVFNLRWHSEGLNFITALSGANLRVGFKTSSPFLFFFNRKPKYNEDIYMSMRYLELLKDIGIDNFFGFKKVALLDQNSALQIPDNNEIFCLMPAGGEGEHKRWGIENYCALASLILKMKSDAYFYFVIGPQEGEYIQTIKDSLPVNSYNILQGGSLGDIVKVSKKAKLTIANDCGPSHLAQMSDVNYIGVWGWKEQNPIHRINTWTMVRPNAIHVVATQGEDIKTVTPAEVFKVAKGFISK
jgi:ADP-heptose:LPS heptosyltransferase